MEIGIILNFKGCKMTIKRWIILSSMALIILISFVYYKQTHLSIWGFNLSKKDIKDVIVLTEKHSYIVIDEDMVSKISEDISKMKRYSKIESFPPQNTKPVRYKKILIRTKGDTNYGGSIWVMENNAVLDSNGYYWDLDYNDLSNTLNVALENANLLN
ncbi:hypothetical protein ACQKP0_12735 [Heyndrickxia sp. NPDC080065]|uniref:hypothetical protein n=1 Tax=Heyndrickxia sp. NPDC080065 TaxID=3390568 RepID=UPI003D013AF2